MQQKTRQILNFLFFLSISAGLTDVVTSILIWNITGSFPEVLKYTLFLFASIIPSAFIIGFLIDKVGSKIPLLISILSLSSIALGLTFFQEQSISYIWLIGLLAGVANTSFYLTSKIIGYQLIPKSDQMTFNTTFANYITASYLVAPLLLPLFKTIFGNQELVLIIAALSSLVGLSLIFQNKQLNQTTNPLNYDVFNPFKKINSERGSLFIFSIILGIKSGIFWALFGVISLIVLKDLTVWGLVAFAVKLATIVVNKKISNLKDIKSQEQLLIISSIIYLSIVVVVIANVSLVTFIIFSFADAIFSTIFSLFYSTYGYEVILNDPKYQDKITEYTVFEETGLTIGRILSIFVLGPVFILATASQNLTLIILTFMVISFIPILIFKLANFSEFLSKNLPS